jgi:threonine aldolase
LSSSRRTNFASDNVAGATPEVMAALVAANAGVEPSYGADAHTERLAALAAEVFECELAILAVTTGTAANALALSLLAPPFGGVYCHPVAHVMTDECGAPELFSGGAKLLALQSPDGKLRPDQLEHAVTFAREMGVHHVKPAAVSLSQATEWGTVYTLAETRALAASAHARGLKVHMDGARFANALAHLGCSPAEATWKCGVDALSFGATKNGALAAEAVVLFDTRLADELEYRRKRSGHLWSKMRFLSAQLVACLENGQWLKHARHANAMAARLASGLAAFGGATLFQAVEANELFVAWPARLADALRSEGYQFYEWPYAPATQGLLYRLVTSWDMSAADIDAFIAAAQVAVQKL